MKGRQQDQHNTILPRYALSTSSSATKYLFQFKNNCATFQRLLCSAKYSIDGERGGSSSYKTSMSLTIHNFQSQDKSAYICVAANSLGTAEASIQIYG